MCVRVRAQNVRRRDTPYDIGKLTTDGSIRLLVKCNPKIWKGLRAFSKASSRATPLEYNDDDDDDDGRQSQK